MLASARKRLGEGHWLAFFGLVLAAWAALYAMQVPADLAAAASVYGAEFWAALCGVEPGWAGYPSILAMWALMAAAMMAPGFVPALATYDDLAGSGAASRRGFFALLAGYGAVWLGFAVLASALQVTLASAALVTPLGQSATPWLTAGLLLGAGAYQFSALKDACLSQCQAPFLFFLRHWREDRWNPARLGLRLGGLCLGCCWALMALAFVGGAMNLAWMGLATLLMTLEKLPRIGRRTVRPLGVALIAAGLAAATRAMI